MDTDEALKEVGSWGRFQIMLYALVAVSSIPNAFLTIQYVLLLHEPNHFCKLSDDFPNVTLAGVEGSESFLDFAIPNETDQVEKVVRSSCKMFKRNYSTYAFEDWSENFNASNEKIPCVNGWTWVEERYERSAVSEFSMVCDNDWMKPMVFTIYMTGMLVGALAGSLADRYGRRPVFLISCISQVVSMILASFSWDYYSLLVTTFLCGSTSLVNYVAAFVVATEVSDVRLRNFFAMGTMYSFSIGYCMLSLFGYCFQNWRTLLQVTAGVTCVFYLPNIWLFPESPRWLIQKGRTEEGVNLLRKISKINKTEKKFSASLEAKGREITSTDLHQTGPKEIVRVLLRSGISSRFIVSTISWSSTALVYYGVSYFSTSFSDDRFLNVFFAGLAELPALCIGYYLVKIVGRPRTLSLFMLLTAFSNVVLPFVPEDSSAIKTVLSMLGKGAVSASFFVLFLMASEIAPTLQRGACMAICSTFARIASIIAPFFMYTRKFHPFIPNGVMGALGFTCTLLVLFYIPETKNVPMPDSIEEAKRNQRFYRFNIFRNLAPELKNLKDAASRPQQENLLAHDSNKV